MKKFILKGLALFFILILLLFIRKEVTPFHVGNLLFKTKYEDYIKRNEKFNAVIFGSSYVYRQVNTPLFDSLLNKYELSTYNFGTGALYNPESYFLYENFLQNIDSGEVKIAFLELQTLRHFLPENQRTTRASYWNNERFLTYAINYIQDSDYPDEKKYAMYKLFIDSYLYSFIDLSIIENQFRRGNLRELGVNGFYHLEKAMLESRGNPAFENRWNDFQFGDGKSKLAERVNAAQKVTEFTPQEAINKTHLELINHFIEASYNKGIHLVIFLPSRLAESQYDELVGISNSLPLKNSIQLYQYPKFRELYEVDNSFDYGHLNRKGADIFTKYFAIEVENILARDQKD
jgi:hypothetical protein